MSAFEFVFTFYSVMLGLAAANVATGFADMWRDRHQTEVGICAPLLAATILVGTMNLWLRFWRSWEGVEVGPWALITLVAYALPLVFLSRAMFPGAGSTTSLEDHFFQHRRVMLAALAATPGFSLIWYAAQGTLTPDWPNAWLAIRFAAPLALMAVTGRTANRLGLVALLVWMLVGLFR